MILKKKNNTNGPILTSFTESESCFSYENYYDEN